MSFNNIYNKIYFGPPGTGKSHKVKQLINQYTTQDCVFRITFHEDYSYYDFVGQYKPVVIKDYVNKIATKPKFTDDDKVAAPIISYNFVPGIFTKSYVEAHKNPDKTIFLVIEEINRGNCSAIFGDIFQLLDRDNNGSKYEIEPNQELLTYLKENISNDHIKLSIPSNLKIIATMNTSDQSLFPIDSAFKRRWQQEYCKIDYKEPSLMKVKIGKTNIKWLDYIQYINEKILNTLNNEDKQLGQWFVQPENATNEITLEDFKNKVVAYLYYDVFKHHRQEIFKKNSFSEVLDLIDKDLPDFLNIKNGK